MWAEVLSSLSHPSFPQSFPLYLIQTLCNTQSKVMYIYTYIIHQLGTYIHISSINRVHIYTSSIHPSIRYINSCYLHGTNVSAVGVGTARRKAKGRKEGWMDGWMDDGQKTLFFPLDSCSLANHNSWFQLCCFLLPTCQQATSSYHLLTY
jgi:hypothetical protein